MTRRKKVPMKVIKNVAIEKRRSRSEVLSGKARDDIAAKNRALKPNAARGKAVAVPREFGQLSAAGSQSVFGQVDNAEILTCFDRSSKCTAASNACHKCEQTKPGYPD